MPIIVPRDYNVDMTPYGQVEQFARNAGGFHTQNIMREQARQDQELRLRQEAERARAQAIEDEARHRQEQEQLAIQAEQRKTQGAGDLKDWRSSEIEVRKAGIAAATDRNNLRQSGQNARAALAREQRGDFHGADLEWKKFAFNKSEEDRMSIEGSRQSNANDHFDLNRADRQARESVDKDYKTEALKLHQRQIDATAMKTAAQGEQANARADKEAAKVEVDAANLEYKYHLHNQPDSLRSTPEERRAWAERKDKLYQEAKAATQRLIEATKRRPAQSPESNIQGDPGDQGGSDYGAEQGNSGRPLDPQTAIALYNQAGQDPDRARMLARQAGFAV